MGGLRGESPRVGPLKTAADHLVKGLPGLAAHQDNPVQYAGHIEVDKARDASMFYWLFESSSSSKEDDIPLIIWLNGGPGCSSLIGEFLEVGPLGLSKSGSIEINKESWLSVGHLLFIDQPVGTGYSFTKGGAGAHCRNDRECNRDLYAFLVNFFKLHNRLMVHTETGYVTRRTILTGESHAGHVIPSFTKFVMEKNTALTTNSKSDSNNNMIINIDALAIGNGWIDPSEQYDVSDFAHMMGLITLSQKNSLANKKSICQSNLKKGQFNSRTCFRLLDDVLDMTKRADGKRVLIYDIRERVTSDAYYPPGHKRFEIYLNRADVKRALHADRVNHRFGQCLDPPYFALRHQDGKGVSNELSYVLDKGINVFLFTGQYDLICNFKSLESSMNKLQWKGSAAWKSADLRRWGTNYGWVKSTGGLTSVVFSDSGHMVAMDQKGRTLEMMKNIVNKKVLNAGPKANAKEMQKLTRRRLLSTDAGSAYNPFVPWALIAIGLILLVLRKNVK